MIKKQWQKPELVTHGTVSELTKGCLGGKQFGFSDTSFQIGPITIPVPIDDCSVGS